MFGHCILLSVKFECKLGGNTSMLFEYTAYMWVCV